MHGPWVGALQRNFGSMVAGVLGVGALGGAAFKAQRHVRNKRQERQRQARTILERFYDSGPDDTIQSVAQQEQNLLPLDRKSHRELQEFEASLQAPDQAAKSAAYWTCVTEKVSRPPLFAVLPCLIFLYLTFPHIVTSLWLLV